MSERIGGWMQTYTGRQFWPLDPRVEDIYPLDIAHALSMICRYGGHSVCHYSVAEHCILMSHEVPEEDALWALLHDATEAYVGDMVRPLKLYMPEYREVEDLLMSVIAEKFGLSGGMPASVKDADTRIILDERKAVMQISDNNWDFNGLKPLGVKIGPLNAADARCAYLRRLEELTHSSAFSAANVG